MAKRPDTEAKTAKAKIEEAVSILKAIGMPREQVNERSGLTLLALLDLKPSTPWTKARASYRGVTEMMDFMADAYDKRYKPNTRETVRRYTLHQFVQAGFVSVNKDDPQRATNSPRTVYSAEPPLLRLALSFGTGKWEASLRKFSVVLPSLRERYAAERELPRIKVRARRGLNLELSPGGHNLLIQKVVEEFCESYTPGASLVYVGDTQKKWAYFDEKLLKSVGVDVQAHGKMPDVVVYQQSKNWLILIEAVTSHGPVTPKRRAELKDLFSGSRPGLVFVTAFLSKKSFVKSMQEIAWETEVWVAEHPTHIIHFNGERFLGPYDD